jgi:hypothetical protein
MLGAGCSVFGPVLGEEAGERARCLHHLALVPFPVCLALVKQVCCLCVCVCVCVLWVLGGRRGALGIAVVAW